MSDNRRVLVTTKIVDEVSSLPLGTEISAVDENGVNKGVIEALKCFGLTYQGVNAFGKLKNETFDDSKEREFSGEKIYKYFTSQEITEARRLVANSCGLVLPGGKETRAYEILLARIAWEQKKTILAICAGQNVLVRALGGSTKKLSPEQREKHYLPEKHKAHKAFAVPGTDFYELIGNNDFNVNSIHSTVIDNPGELNILAYDKDENIEIVGLPEFKNHFVLGTRFHPESFFMNVCNSSNPEEELKNTINENAISLAVFGEFAKSCERERKGKRQEKQII